MPQLLRQSTQAIVHVGPFLNSATAVAPITNILISAADDTAAIKHDTSAAPANISGRTWSALAEADGWYSLTLTTGDTDTVGPLDVVIHDDSAALPGFKQFQVVEEAIYDALFSASATGFDAAAQVTVGAFSASIIASSAISDNAVSKIATSMSATATSALQATNAIRSAAISADAVTKIQAGLATPTNITGGTITTVTSVTTVVGLSASAITSASISNNAVSKIATSISAAALSALTQYDPPTSAEVGPLSAKVTSTQVFAQTLASSAYATSTQVIANLTSLAARTRPRIMNLSSGRI